MSEQKNLKSIVESVLFVSGEPIKISKIAGVSGASNEEIKMVIAGLREDYQGRGLAILEKEDTIQMTSSPENAGIISELIKSEIQENLSRAALEVLSIVAYRGPITRLNVEAIRGVNCSFTLRTLLLRGLLERVENPSDNRGYLYKISFDFLRKLGVGKLEDLPDFESLSKDARIDSIINQ